MADDPSEFASPPCFMHELDESGRWAGGAGQSVADKDVARWRKSERERLLALRRLIPAALRAEAADAIAAQLDQALGNVGGRVVGGYWPIRSEPNLLDWLERIASLGAICALPVVVEKGRPLIYRRWRAGDPLEPGVWRIPTPTTGPEIVPDVVLAPLVGFTASCWRLGYGGGYFDRTLQALHPKPVAIGVGYEDALIPTIYPQPHDIPMELVVTELHVRRAGGIDQASSI